VRRDRSDRIRRAAWLAGLAALLVAGTASAERAWIKDELRLNIRTGAGTQYRIVGVVETGDQVDIVSRADGWTQVKTGDGRTGWIPAGYLQPEAPARMVVEQHVKESAELRKRVEDLTQQVEALSGGNADLAGRDAEQQAEIDRLTRENMELRVGARWPEWVAGASILFVGGLLGILIRGASQRRPSPRIRI
jgi:SH3 domain protein